MKITICGSIAFYKEMQEQEKNLKELGHEVKLPPSEIKNHKGSLISVSKYYEIRKAMNDDASWIWDRKAEAIQSHFDKIEWSDVILVLNYSKNDVSGYIGGNTLMELGVAFHLNKPIFLLNEIPELPYKEEVLGVKPILLNGNLSKIKI